MKVFLDDVRDPSLIYGGHDGEWAVCRNYSDFCELIDSCCRKIEIISFDHDLGEASEKTGYDAVCLVERMVREDRMPNLVRMRCHSANPWGKQRIESAIRAIMSFIIDNRRELES